MQETGFFTSFCLFLPSFEQTTDDGLILIKHFDAKKEKKVDRVVMSHIGIFFIERYFYLEIYLIMSSLISVTKNVPV